MEFSSRCRWLAIVPPLRKVGAFSPGFFFPFWSFSSLRSWVFSGAGLCPCSCSFPDLRSWFFAGAGCCTCSCFVVSLWSCSSQSQGPVPVSGFSWGCGMGSFGCGGFPYLWVWLRPAFLSLVSHGVLFLWLRLLMSEAVSLPVG